MQYDTTSSPRLVHLMFLQQEDEESIAKLLSSPFFHGQLVALSLSLNSIDILSPSDGRHSLSRVGRPTTTTKWEGLVHQLVEPPRGRRRGDDESRAFLPILVNDSFQSMIEIISFLWIPTAAWPDRITSVTLYISPPHIRIPVRHILESLFCVALTIPSIVIS